MRTRHLAFDFGAESGRAIVGTLDNGALTLDEIHRFSTGGHQITGASYRDVVAMYDAMLDALRLYRSNYGETPDSVGVDTWGCDFGLLDEHGKLLSIPRTYRDKRVNGMDKELDRVIGNKRLYELTGVQMLPINSLNQLAGMINQRDPTLAISKRLLFMGDLMNYFLTGKQANEFSMLSISQLYNNAAHSWENQIFDSFGIPKVIQGDIIYPGELVGLLHDDICRETGVSSAKVIAPATHDTASAIVAVPANSSENWAFLSSGTWSIAGIELDAPVINDISYKMNVSNSGGAMGKMQFLKNVMGLWIIQQCKSEWSLEHPGLDYPEIVNMAQNARPFSAFIEPDDLSFFNPNSMLESISRYIRRTGQEPVDTDDIGQVTRIVYESLALKYKHVLKRIQRAVKKTVDVMYIIGGGAKNDMLNQLTANALGIPVRTGHAESTAIGNILVQCAGLGIVNSLDEMRYIVKRSFKFREYAPEDDKSWEKAYDEFMRRTGQQ